MSDPLSERPRVSRRTGRRSSLCEHAADDEQRHQTTRKHMLFHKCSFSTGLKPCATATKSAPCHRNEELALCHRNEEMPSPPQQWGPTCDRTGGGTGLQACPPVAQAFRPVLRWHRP